MNEFEILHQVLSNVHATLANYKKFAADTELEVLIIALTADQIVPPVIAEGIETITSEYPHLHVSILMRHEVDGSMDLRGVSRISAINLSGTDLGYEETIAINNSLATVSHATGIPSSRLYIKA